MLPPSRRAARLLSAPALVALVVIFMLGAWLKLVTNAGGPLWLDEGWTLGIVERRGWAAFAEQLRLDVNPPLYFLVLRAWTAVAGLSDAALRAPSTAFAVLSALPPLLAGRALPRTERWAWAAVLGLMPQAVFFAQEARGYALLLLLESGAAVAYVHLLARPDIRRAALWCGLTSLACLTHHHAALLGALQGIAYLAVHRMRAVRTWPAALLFAPWLAWTAAQAPRVLQFGRPEFAWYGRLAPADLAEVWALLTGGAGAVWLALLAGGLVAGRLPPIHRLRGAPIRASEAVVASTALVFVLVVVGLGFLKPSFTPRYLVPALPGTALALVLALRAAAPALAPLLQAAFAVGLGAAVATAASRSDTAGRRAYQFETASADLGRAGVRRLAFLWDNPTDGVLAPGERGALADAFFARARRPVAVTGVVLRPGEDPNARLAATPGDGLLWLYDLRVPRTAARVFPPRLEGADPALSCRRYAGGALGVVACVRAPLRWPT